MESSGYFLETTSSWICREAPIGAGGSLRRPSGSLPLLFNMSFFRCNRSSEWSAIGNETEVGTKLPQFNQMSLVKTIVLSTMFAVAFTGNVTTISDICNGTTVC